MRDDPTAAALVTRAQEGDQQAWDALVERYAPLVWSICRRHRLGRADADDVSQNVWLRLAGQLDHLRDPAAIAGWLATTTARECARVLHAALREAFTALPPCCQRLLALLTEDPPVPYAQISARLDIPVGSIGPSRGRCLDKLRRHPAIAALINTEAHSLREQLHSQATPR